MLLPRSLAIAAVMTALLAAPTARADLVLPSQEACFERAAGDACSVGDQSGACAERVNTFKNRTFLVCDLALTPVVKPAADLPSAPPTPPTSSDPAPAPSAREASPPADAPGPPASTTPPPAVGAGSRGCSCDLTDDGSGSLGWGVALGLAGAGAALLIGRRRRSTRVAPSP